MRTSNAVNDAEKWDHSYIAYGTTKWFRNSGRPFGSFLKTLNIQLPYDPEIALLGIYHRQVKTLPVINLKINLYTNVQSGFICNNLKLETTQMYFNESVVKQSVGYA